MEYETLLVNESLGGITITINRPEHRNSVNETFLKEINRVLDLAEQDPACRILVLEGQNGFFCTGMDFEEVAEPENQTAVDPAFHGNNREKQPATEFYMQTIKRFTLTPKIIISVIDGQVIAGGVGIAAASDLAIATPRSSFSLSEALWGLLPSMVTPYLIRRVGFQVAYRMTLTTLPISAREAYETHLVDEISENPGQIIHKWCLRLSKLQKSTIMNMKQFFRKMWIISDTMEKAAVHETTHLLSDPEVIQNITNYVKFQRLPWEEK